MKTSYLYFRAYLAALLMLAAVPAEAADVKELFEIALADYAGQEGRMCEVSYPPGARGHEERLSNPRFSLRPARRARPHCRESACGASPATGAASAARSRLENWARRCRGGDSPTPRAGGRRRRTK